MTVHPHDCLSYTADGPCTCGMTTEPTTGENPAYNPPAELVIHADGVNPPVCEVTISVTGTVDVDEARRLRDALDSVLEVAFHVEGQFAVGLRDPGVDR